MKWNWPPLWQSAHGVIKGLAEENIKELGSKSEIHGSDFSISPLAKKIMVCNVHTCMNAHTSANCTHLCVWKWNSFIMMFQWWGIHTEKGKNKWGCTDMLFSSWRLPSKTSTNELVTTRAAANDYFHHDNHHNLPITFTINWLVNKMSWQFWKMHMTISQSQGDIFRLLLLSNP